MKYLTTLALTVAITYASAGTTYFKASFEGSLDGLNIAEPTATLTPTTNAPSVIIRDGSYALKIEHSNPAPEQVELATIDHVSNVSWWNAIQDTNSTTISVDVHVPASAVTSQFSYITITYEGDFAGGGNTSVSWFHGVFASADSSFTAELDLSNYVADIANSTWGRCTIKINGAAGATLTPVYIDNFRVHDEEVKQLAIYEWSDQYQLVDGDRLPTADPDGDQVNNIYEFGLGGDPTNRANQGISPTYDMEMHDGTNYLIYAYPARSMWDSGLSYHLETSSNLVSGAWTKTGYEALGIGSPGGDFNYVTNRIPVTGNNGGYVRLVIRANYPE